MYEKTIVAYHIGRASAFHSLSVDGRLLDFEEIEELADKIVKRWVDQIDIRNFEEEGYIGAYAERVIHGIFMKGEVF